ncbi:hypothetical protein IJT17_00505 [bacterium]|nr:hypothetical protein [bacterium]
MDIAIRLALAVAERTWLSCQESRQGCGENYAAYPLRGGNQLWSVKLDSAEDSQAAIEPKSAHEDLCLSLGGTEARRTEAAVRLAPSGAKRIKLAMGHVCKGFEFSLNKPAALVASGMLTVALTVLAGTATAEANRSAELPVNSSRAVQCRASHSGQDSLLAEVTQPARHRVFSRARDRMGGSGSGTEGHTNTSYSNPKSEIIPGQDTTFHSNIKFDPGTGTWGGTWGSDGHMNFNPPAHFNNTHGDQHTNLTPSSPEYPAPSIYHLNVNPDGGGVNYHLNNGIVSHD